MHWRSEQCSCQKKDHKIRIGIGSCAAVIVFPKSVANDHLMLHTPSKATSCRPASGKLLPDLGAQKVQVKLKDGSLKYVNPTVADTHGALMTVSEMNEMGHDVFFPRERQKHHGVCVPRGQWHETGARESEWSFRVASRACSIQSEYFKEQQFRYVLFTFGAGTDRRHHGQDCEGQSAPNERGMECSDSYRRSGPLVVGGSSGSLDVIYPTPGGGLLEE